MDIGYKGAVECLSVDRSSVEANFTSHPLTVTQSSKVKLVRYQPNPTPNWGPATRAESGIKRKRNENEE